ncbi:MAG: hypothetical protein LBV07_03160 [Syntrophobacterales bacterium]|jgi:hypothetical protein|nr:hypothetical protein [Syntrophobacterales bacterium]
MNSVGFLPPELQSVIGAEKIDFSVLAKRNKPANQSIYIIFFGLVWTAFTSIFVIGFFGPLFKRGEVHFKVNGVPTTGSWENLEPMIFPALLIGVFVLVGIGILSWGLYSFFQKGGYFVGTASRLLSYHKGKIYSFDWEQFTGNMEINKKKGDISLQLRYGKMVSRKNSPDKFVPDIVYISGTPDILEIEKICRKRIKENDPTPANFAKSE